jgi:hypothetical protein
MWVSDKEKYFCRGDCTVSHAQKLVRQIESEEAGGASSSKVVIARHSRPKDGVASARL